MGSKAWAAVVAVFAVVVAAGALAAVIVPKHPAGNPFTHGRLYVDHDSDAAWAVQNLIDAGRKRDAAALSRIANHSWATWFGDWSNGHKTTYADVKARVDKITKAGALPVLVAYNIPSRDCGSYSAGGAATRSEYQSWIRELAHGIGQARAVVILEPDALAELDCLSPAKRAEYLSLLNYAVRVLGAHPHTTVYLDAGNESWRNPREIAARLRAAGVAHARGFAINVSNFYSTASEKRYGDRIARLLGGAHYVIDTSRNGSGPPPNDAWCNPPGRSLGPYPGAPTHDRYVDAYLWIKAPGESDGTCGGAPKAGVWWLHYALGLALRSR